MHIGFDLDDTKAPFNHPFIVGYINRKYGTQFTYEQITTQNYPECPAFKVLGWDLSRWKAEVDAFSETEEFKQLQPYPAILEGIRVLHAAGHTLSIVTGRDAGKLEAWTKHWLALHFAEIPFQHVIFTNHYGGGPKIKKSEACRAVGIDQYVEDHFDHVKDCASAQIPVVLIDRPWNRKVILPSLKKYVKAVDHEGEAISYLLGLK